MKTARLVRTFLADMGDSNVGDCFRLPRCEESNCRAFTPAYDAWTDCTGL